MKPSYIQNLWPSAGTTPKNRSTSRDRLYDLIEKIQGFTQSIRQAPWLISPKQFKPTVCTVLKLYCCIATIKPRDDRYGRNEAPGPKIYVESYDIGHNGKPINAHPLNAQRKWPPLQKSCKRHREKQDSYLKSRGLLPVKHFYVNPQEKRLCGMVQPATGSQFVFLSMALNIKSRQNILYRVWYGKANAETFTRFFALKGKAKTYH